MAAVTMQNHAPDVREDGTAHMVDVSAKDETTREATAGRPHPAEVLGLLAAGGLPKGDALAVARVAGIMAAKKTPDLIPLCHPLPITKVTVDFELDADSVTDLRHGQDPRRHRGRDGGADGRLGRGAERVRHDQGRGQARGPDRHQGARQKRRQERGLDAVSARTAGIIVAPPVPRPGPTRTNARR